MNQVNHSPTIDIDFNPELFNNLFWHLEEAINNPAIRYIFIYGGSSSSKTYTVCQLTAKNMLSAPDYNTMVMRKVSEDIKDSIYADIKGIVESNGEEWTDWNLNEFFICQQNLIKCATGSYTRFRGLDDSEKVKGITNFKKIVLEELSQFDYEDFSQIKKRLRGGENQQIIGIFNPISEEHWIKKQIFDLDEWEDVGMGEYPISGKQINKKGNTLILRSNYVDNKWIVGPHNIDKHIIDDYEWDRVHDYGKYEVYALGNWGKLVTGGEFYKKFKREIHVKPLKYDKNLPLHISFDKNKNPYFPCGIFQIDGKEIRLIDEICAKNPNNTVNWITMEIERRYRGHNAGMYIYGDSTAAVDDVTDEKGYDMYRRIIDALAMFRPGRRVSAANPNIKGRGEFFNDILECNPKALGIRFFINTTCTESITDFYLTKEGADGRKDKTMVTDKVTKVRYQPHGHITDLSDYLLCFAFAKEYSEWETGTHATTFMYSKPSKRW